MYYFMPIKDQNANIHYKNLCCYLICIEEYVSQGLLTEFFQSFFFFKLKRVNEATNYLLCKQINLHAN